MRDKYLNLLRQMEHQKRIKEELERALYRNNRDVMNQPPATQEELDAWNAVEPITFNLDNRKKVN